MRCREKEKFPNGTYCRIPSITVSSWPSSSTGSCGKARNPSRKALFTAPSTSWPRRTGEDPLKLFERAVDNVKPVLEVRSRRVGGSTYQVPVEIRPERRQALAIRWLIQYARGRGEKSMQEKLAGEFHGRGFQQGQRNQKERRYPQNGRSQQGIRSLQVVVELLRD